MEYIFSILMLILSALFGSDMPGQTTQTTDNQTGQTVTVVSVTDGDTIIVDIDGREETVRYIGVDTPEPYRDGEPACYSKDATAYNQQLLREGEVSLVADAEDRDRFGRLLRYVYVGDVMVNQELLRGGYATTLSIQPNTAYASQFAAVEVTAREAGVGLWGACAGSVTDAPPEPAQPDQSAEVTTDQLPAGQRQLLERLGIDAETISFTQQMIACARGAVGDGRLTEIISGQTPSFFEGVALAGCYINS